MPPFRWFRLFERLGILLRKLAKDEFQATFLGSGGPRTDLNILEKQLTDCKDSRLELVCTGRRGSYTEPLANRGDDIIDKIAAVDAGATASARRLEYTDRTSMAVALEVRVPFLDYRVVEFSQALGYRHKLRNGTSKAILRDAFKDLIPPENLHLPKKGFSPPLALWMRDTLDGYFDEHMGPEYTRREGIFDRGEIGRLRMEHKAGKRDNSMELFGIMMFDVWYRKHILRD